LKEEKQKILILGAGVMQGPALSIAAEMGLETVAADANGEAECIPLASRFEKVDLKDREGIAALALSLKENGGLSGILTAGTDFSGSVAWAAEKAGLPGIPFESAIDASDKGRMRKRFREAGVPSPEFIVMEALPKPGSALPFPWPVVVKPVDNMGARGCRRVDNDTELEAAVTDALKFSRSGKVIIEEYMEGPEFSVDALVYNGEITICGFADRHIFFPPYFIEMGHTMPSSQDECTIHALLDAFSLGVKALGITNGAAKGDIKLTSRGPMIGEIAARLSGGYMSGWTYPYSSGVLPTRGAIEIALGKKPTCLKPEWNHTSAERAFISIPGKVLSITGIEKAKVMPCIKNVFTRIKPGSLVSFPDNNVTKCGNIISAAANRDEAINAAESAARSILIRLDSPNKATEAFLSASPEPSGKITFPPDAFSLDARIDSRLLSLLNALPETQNDNPLEPQASCQLYLYPFPEFTEAGLKDYVGRSVTATLEAIRLLTGLELPLGLPGAASALNKASYLGKSFWKALIRGGYQGAVYYIDSLKARNDK